MPTRLVYTLIKEPPQRIEVGGKGYVLGHRQNTSGFWVLRMSLLCAPPSEVDLGYEESEAALRRALYEHGIETRTDGYQVRLCEWLVRQGYAKRENKEERPQ